MEIDTADLVRSLIAPAIMISAASMLALSTNARLIAVLGQLRSVHCERVELLGKPVPSDRTEQYVRTVCLDGMRAQMLMLRLAAQWLRNTMVTLFLSVVFMVLCSACIGVTAVAEHFFPGVAVCFGAGSLLIIIAMVTSTIEIAGVLRTAAYDHWRSNELGTDGTLEQGAT